MKIKVTQAHIDKAIEWRDKAKSEHGINAADHCVMMQAVANRFPGKKIEAGTDRLVILEDVAERKILEYYLYTTEAYKLVADFDYGREVKPQTVTINKLKD